MFLYLKNKENNRFAIKSIKPVRLIALTFTAVIIFGSLLLMLPVANAGGVATNYINALFTATSAVCVTGLTVVATAEYWSLFGKTVILFLIQIGGLGLMTFITMLSVLSKKKITLKQRLIIKDAFSQQDVQGMVTLVKYIIGFTLTTEAIIAIILAIRFSFDFPIFTAIGYGIFHSVSAFCNSGIDILGENSLVSYQGDVLINITLSSLIIAGGLGFPVWLDIKAALKLIIKEKHDVKLVIHRMSLHSKIVLSITAALLVVPAFFFFIVEFANPDTIGNLAIGDKIIMSAFQSTSLRSAGFFSAEQSGFTYPSKILSMILMFIGGSPASTAGGIKTTTIGVLIAAVISVIKGRQKVSLFGRTISFYDVQKALAVFLLGQVLVIASTIILSLTEAFGAFQYAFIDILFEMIAAFSTVGLSLGITPYISEPGKIMIILVMLIGRLGPVSAVAVITSRQLSAGDHIQYPMGSVIVG